MIILIKNHKQFYMIMGVWWQYGIVAALHQTVLQGEL